ncbi:MAG: pyridoxal-dependent decarboxylase [Anaerolineales bacterium]
MKRLLNDSAQRAIAYLEHIEQRKVAPDPQAVKALQELDTPLQDQSSDPHEVLSILDKYISPATLATTSGRFFGYVIGGSYPVSVAANWLASAWDQNTGLYEATPGTAYIEELALNWLIDLFDLPPESGGAFVTGATVANLCGLATGRHVVLDRAGWDVEGDGLFNAPPITVIIGAEAHPVLFKSLGLLGLGRNRVVCLPTDNQGRMRADQLPAISGPTIVCLQAGNLNTGAFDPFEEIIDRVHAAGGWVHVDGAFGLWAAVSPSHAHLTAGVEKADSLATDAHKYLNVPYDSGLAFVRNPEALRSAMAITAEYLPTDSAYRNPSDYTPELSRRARGIEVWAALKYLGKDGVAKLVDDTCRHARRFAEGFSAAGYQILNEVVLNQVLVSFGEPQKTLQIISDIQEDGTCWMGSTKWQGHTAMRISVSSWATTDEDVEKSLAAILRIAKKY